MGLERHQLMSAERHRKESYGSTDALEDEPDMVGVDDSVVLATGDRDGRLIRRGGLIRPVVEDEMPSS